jgi:hypothetical protein
MIMKRILSLAGAAVAVAALSTAVAGAAPSPTSDVNGPTCADVTDGAGVYNGTAVNLRLTLAAPPCRSVMYTLYVLSADGTTLLGSSSQTQPTADPTRITFNVPVSDGSTTVCVYATTSIGGHVFDRAPDTGCIQLVVDGPISAQAMR